MTDFLDALERQLLDAVDRHAADTARLRDEPHASQRGGTTPGQRGAEPRWWSAAPRRWSSAPGRVALAVLAAALVAAAGLVASGALGGGSHSTLSAHRFPHVVGELPLRGHSRLSSLRVADPAGGAPWGMRIVHTATNLVCLQVGRLDGGRLRPLGGVEGDGVLHLLPPPASPPGSIGNGLVENRVQHAGPPAGPSPALGNCHPASVIYAGDGSAIAPPVFVSRQPGESVRVSFGLLGPRALSVGYHFHGRSRTQAVEAGTGAYLIVLPAAAAITTVTYRVGTRTCRQSASAPPVSACQTR